MKFNSGHELIHRAGRKQDQILKLSAGVVQAQLEGSHGNLLIAFINFIVEVPVLGCVLTQ